MGTDAPSGATAASTIPAELLAAYRATDYRVELPHRRRLQLRIGRHSRACDRLLREHGARTAALVTAWNPFSRKASDPENAAAQRALLRDLARRRIAFLPAVGIGKDPGWTPERSVLALGLGRPAARRLARKYRQFAFVSVRRGAPAALVLLK